MTDMRRSLLWGVFLVSLFLLYDAWNKHNGQPSLFGGKPAVQATAGGSRPASGAQAGAVPGASGTGSAALPEAAAPVAGEKIVVQTDLVKATLDSTGGSLVRLELLQQKEHAELPWYQPLLDIFGGKKAPRNESNVVLFDQSASRTYLAQTGVLNLPKPISHFSAMRVLPGERTLKEGQANLDVAFEATEGDIKLVKTYTFKRGDYTIGVKHQITNTGKTAVDPQLYLQLLRDHGAAPGESSFYFTFTGPAIYTDASKYTKIDFKSIDKRGPNDKADHDVKADNGWVAMVQHYFTSAWLLGSAGDERRPREFFTRKVDGNYAVGMLMQFGSIAPDTTKAVDARLYAGPQEEDKLSAIAPGLELVKDYGWFTILSKPLFWLLTQLHKIIGNWGWAIVALVVLLKIAFFWLNSSAYRSMAKMKAINPKIMEMRERLKDKPQQMQQEMMRIYREEKVNPIGGCLPIFIQMPFFIALYWVLLSSVEMRQAPWLGWITDLSAKDPLFILPLLMMGTSVLTAWLQPAPPDPMQARMMMIMPVIFSVMFFAFPAGLVLYWLTNNILSIAQQYLINRQMGVKSGPVK